MSTDDSDRPEATGPDSSTSKKRKSTVNEIEVDLSLPEPPSKKAKRLLKKGKPIPTKPTSDDEKEGDDDDKAEGKTANGGDKKKKERSPYGVWIGNLSFSVTKNELRKWLVDNSGGAISEEGITRVHIPTTTEIDRYMGKDQKKTVNKGFAYVDFTTFEASVAAAALSEQELSRRKVLIKDSKNFEGRPEKKKEDDDDAAGGNARAGEPKFGKPDSGKKGSTKIFVGNLGFATTEDELWAHFEKCGKIRWLKVATFEDTGKCKGYGWVNFEEAEAAEWAVKGFVKIKEAVETVEDFMEEGKTRPAGEDAPEAMADKEEGADKMDVAAKEKSQPVRLTKTRKWWVNQLHGRPLKVELAEDDQLRYKKRFGKDAPQRRGNDAERQSGDRPSRLPRRDTPGQERRADKPKYHDDIAVARLTGAAVAPQGKKTSFE